LGGGGGAHLPDVKKPERKADLPHLGPKLRNN